MSDAIYAFAACLGMLLFSAATAAAPGHAGSSNVKGRH